MRSRFIITALLVAAPAVAAQTVAPFGLEVRPFGGVLMPTAAQHDDFKAAELTGVQVAFEFSPYFHLVGSGSFAHSHNRFAFTNKRTDIWQYDVGGEANAIFALPKNWLFRPFLGMGIGGRTYDYRDAAYGTYTCTAGYGSVGTEFQRGLWAVRGEVRDYLSCFKSPMGGGNETRNEVGLALGLAYHVR